MQTPKLFLLLAITITNSCTYVYIDKKIEYKTKFKHSENIVVLFDESKQHLKPSFKRCIDKNMEYEFGFSYIYNQTIVDDMFPWLESKSTPTNSDAVTELLINNQHLFEQIKQQNITKIVIVNADLNSNSDSQGLTCANLGCFGLISWSKNYIVKLNIIDLKPMHQSLPATTLGEVTVEATGSSYIPAVIVPLPLIAYVEKNACQRSVDKVKSLVL